MPCCFRQGCGFWGEEKRQTSGLEFLGGRATTPVPPCIVTFCNSAITACSGQTMLETRYFVIRCRPSHKKRHRKNQQKNIFIRRKLNNPASTGLYLLPSTNSCIKRRNSASNSRSNTKPSHSPIFSLLGERSALLYNPLNNRDHGCAQRSFCLLEFLGGGNSGERGRGPR